MPVLKVNGAKFNYLQRACEREGECEDVVFVHGLATSMAFWCLHYVPEFCKRFKVTVYDLRGHGRSTMSESGYTAPEMALDLEAILDELGIKQAHFVSHSFGGAVTLNFACKHPDRVKSLLLADTHIGVIRHLASQERDWGYGERMREALAEAGVDLDPNDPYFGYKLLKEVAILQRDEKPVPEALLKLSHPIAGQSGKRTAQQWVKLLTTTNAEAELTGDDGLTLDALRALKFPVIAIYGEDSHSMSTGNALLQVFPHADFRKVREAGHFFPSSRPGEVMAKYDEFARDTSVNGVKRRSGDASGQAYFRADRIHKGRGGWYVFLRQIGQTGPFASPEGAAEFLEQYLSGILSSRKS